MNRAEGHRKVGEWIRRNRERKGVSQRVLARQIGKTQGYVSAIERGRRVDLVTLAQIADALKIDIRGVLAAVRGAKG